LYNATVGLDARRRHIGGAGRDIDDAAVVLVFHRRNHCLRTKHGPQQIYAHHAVELFVGEILGAVAVADGGDIQQCVHPAERRQNLFNHGEHLATLSYVGTDIEPTLSRFALKSRNGFLRPVVTNIRQTHMIAAARHGQRRRTPQSPRARSTRDNGHSLHGSLPALSSAGRY
jgi:hypothetical protein